MAQVDLTKYGNIQNDMSEGEILSRLGEPDSKQGTPNMSRWYWLSEPDDIQQITTMVEFWNGRVHEKQRTVS